MDVATLTGLLAGFGLIAAAIAAGGAPASFVDGPAMLIVVGGTFAVTLMSYSMADLGRAAGVLHGTVFARAPGPAAAAASVLRLAELARLKGPLALQSMAPELARQPFLADSVQMVVDGAQAREIERVMGDRAEAIASHLGTGVGVLRKAAEVSPAMGLIGTLVGLVQMLGVLDDPARIGPGMAVALLTTFYGAVLSNMVFAPLAAKIERRGAAERMLNELYLAGALSIGRRENPRRLETLLNARLPPAERIHHFD